MASISLLDLQRAYTRVRKHAIQTPLKQSKYLSERWDAEVWIKWEQQQAIGAFKIRGAANFFMQLSSEERRKGVITHSSGNHAQAVAYMGNKMGVSTIVVMPKDSNPVKIANAKKWGARVIVCEPSIESRLQTASEWIAKTGAIMVPPFDHNWIISGQASASMECFRELKDIDLIFK